MPYEIKKNGNSYEVINRDTGKVHAKHTTLEKAKAQVRLLHMTDHDSSKSKNIARPKSKSKSYHEKSESMGV